MNQPLMRAWWVGVGVTLCTAAAAVSPQPEAVALDASRDYLVGASVANGAGHLGDDDRRWGLRPLWAFQWGRFRFATGRASALLSLGRDTVESGVSTVLAGEGPWTVSTALQYDEGRGRSDHPLLAGLPPVRDTVRGRLSVGYKLHQRWSLGASASQDVLGRGGGLSWSGSLRYHHPVSKNTYWDASLGTSGGNAAYLRTQYGIDPDTARRTGRATYLPGAGWDGWQLGWGITSAIHQRWVVFGGVNWSRAQGAAADSPLLARRTVVGANIGLAYRCCR